MKTLIVFLVWGWAVLNPETSSAWVDSTLFSPKLFLENKGQFNNISYLRGMPQPSYAMYHRNTKIFFSTNQIAYTLHRWVHDEAAFAEFLKSKSKRLETQKDIDDRQALKKKIDIAKTATVLLEWLNADPDCRIEASGMAKEYFNFGMDHDITHDINFVKGYKKIVYKEMYPGIDIEYVFHERTGIKYNIIVQPGADLSKVKLKYSGAESISLDEKNNLIIKTPLGDFIDHAPVSFYENGVRVKSSFELHENTVSFSVTQTAGATSSPLIIDPWVSGTGPEVDTAYEVGVDPSGNVFIYGDYNSQVKKYDNTGAPQWTFLSGPGYLYNATAIGGDLAVDPAGNSYCSGSECIRKLSPGGVSLWLYAPMRNITNIACCETGWRLVFDPANNRLYGGGSNGQTKATWYDPANGNPEWLPNGFNACNIINPPCPSACPNSNGEIRHITRAPNGNFYGYTAIGDGSTATSVSTITGFNPAFAGIYRSCNVPPSPYFTNGPITPGGPPTYYYGCYYMGNGITASNCFIYISSGDQVHKFDIYTPSLLGTINIANGLPQMNSGILADLANNFYVGTQTGISAYTPAMTLITSVATTGRVHDMAFAPGNNIAACGMGFVGVFANLVQGGTPITCNPSPNLPMTAIADTLSPTGCSSNNAVAWVDTIMNGIGPYVYNWSNGATTSAISNLAPGTYTCVIVDSSCPKETTQVVVNIPSAASFTITPASTPATCFGSATGTASVSVSGGSSPYSYSWNPSGQNSSTASGLSAGLYTVTVTDATGCTGTKTVSITQPTAISTTVSSTAASCGSNNGTATVAASGGVGSYSYLWNPSSAVSATATGLAGGNYSVTVTDANGCTGAATVSVTLSTGLSASVTSTPASCGGNSGTATVSSSSGTPPFSYVWSNGQTAQTATNLSSGSYSVTVSDVSGCTSVNMIIVAASGSITATATNSAVCMGQIATLSASGGSAYAWSNGTTGNTISVFATSTTTYSVIVSSGTCSDTVTATVTVSPGPTASAWSNVTISAGSSATLSASGGGSYLWSNGATDDIITVNPLVTTVYCVTVTDTSGCTDTSCVTVYIESVYCSYADDQLFVPDAFSPNGDTKNDRLGVYYPDISCIKEFVFIIYDRWGEKVFEADNLSVLWDGTYKGKIMNTAVFVYYMKVSFIDGNEVIRKGNVSLIR